MKRKQNGAQLSLAPKLEIPPKTPPEFIPYLQFCWAIMWGAG
jgi:hypothetical protein